MIAGAGGVTKAPALLIETECKVGYTEKWF